MNSRPLKEAALLVVTTCFATLGIGAVSCDGWKYCQDKAMDYGVIVGSSLAALLLIWRYWSYVKPEGLRTKYSRIAFLIGLVFCIPLLGCRVLPETWKTADITEFWVSSFLTLIVKPYSGPQWFDYAAPFGWCFLTVAFWWRQACCAKDYVHKWIDGT